MKRLLQVLGLLAAFWVGVRAAANPLNFYQEYEFQPGLRLNFYPALKNTGPNPLVIFVHGGGWASGSKNSLGLGAYELHQSGFAVASLEYRLVPQATWPAQLEDVRAGIAYLRRHAQELNVDPKHFGAWGESAGGHLVSLLGLREGGALQAVADLYGPTDFLSKDNATAKGVQYVRDLVAGQDSLLAEASPVSYARPDAPPFLILHGEDDHFVPFTQAQHLQQRLQAVHAQVELITVHHADHGFRGHPEPSRAALAQLLVDFFQRHLVAARPPGTGLQSRASRAGLGL
jgi:acetyl esterase/lipase